VTVGAGDPEQMVAGGAYDRGPGPDLHAQVIQVGVVVDTVPR
jgi:hypothetical protein